MKLPVFRVACFVILLVLVVGLLGCGSSDEGDGDEGETTGGSVTATTATNDGESSPAATVDAPVAASPTTSAGGAEVPTGLEGTLTVFAAASLTESFTAMQALLEDSNPELTIEYNFGGSQQLVTQLAEGADADVFAAANMTQMIAAIDEGRIDGEPVIFVRNHLAIIVPSDNPAGIEQPADLANDGIKLVVANPDVPVGGYTLEVLDAMSADPSFGSDFRARVEGNVVSQEDNVKQVVTKVQLGEADAGVVYVSDVTRDAREDIALVEIPEEFNVIAEYPIAPVEGGDGELAQAFIDFLLSEDGQAILEEYGFTGGEQ